MLKSKEVIRTFGKLTYIYNDQVTSASKEHGLTCIMNIANWASRALGNKHTGFRLK
jgi:hypothetical protein